MKIPTGRLVAVALLAGPATAHHSSVPWYDLNADPITVTGTVTEFQFQNPHVFIYLDVEDDDGAVEQWRIESTSKNRLVRVGWTERSILIGQTLTATGFPARQGNGVDAEAITVAESGLEWGR